MLNKMEELFIDKTFKSNHNHLIWKHTNEAASVINEIAINLILEHQKKVLKWSKG